MVGERMRHYSCSGHAPPRRAGAVEKIIQAGRPPGRFAPCVLPMAAISVSTSTSLLLEPHFYPLAHSEDFKSSGRLLAIRKTISMYNIYISMKCFSSHRQSVKDFTTQTKQPEQRQLYQIVDCYPLPQLARRSSFCHSRSSWPSPPCHS